MPDRKLSPMLLPAESLSAPVPLDVLQASPCAVSKLVEYLNADQHKAINVLRRFAKNDGVPVELAVNGAQVLFAVACSEC